MKRLNACAFGSFLLKLFLTSTAALIIYYIVNLVGKMSLYGLLKTEPAEFWGFTILFIAIEFVLFWVGIIIVYINCKQLGIKLRALGIIFGLVPIVHLILLFKIISTADFEVKVEKAKIKLNKKRESEEICKTKYPILMVHGVFFRDFTHFNYWGRIPEELKKNGATIFYGEHNSASSVKDSAEQLVKRIEDIKKETGCEKVNVIAHSKGGLDMRYAISMLGIKDSVASLTTINTPHRGCEFADYLLSKIPEKQKEAVAKAYNAGAKKLGDVDPDFISAVTDLTHSACEKMNEEVKDAEGVYYSSVGSIQSTPVSGRFPLNMSYLLVKHFDGNNDGLVGEKSFPWGSDFTMLRPSGKRGISHGDMIDLNRENFKGFDVREFYVELVSKLKKMGY